MTLPRPPNGLAAGQPCCPGRSAQACSARNSGSGPSGPPGLSPPPTASRIAGREKQFSKAEPPGCGQDVRGVGDADVEGMRAAGERYRVTLSPHYTLTGSGRGMCPCLWTASSGFVERAAASSFPSRRSSNTRRDTRRNTRRNGRGDHNARSTPLGMHGVQRDIIEVFPDFQPERR